MIARPFSRPATYSRSLRARGTERTDFLTDVDTDPTSHLSFQVRYTYDSSLYELVQMRAWPAEGLTRVPYWVYQDADIYQREQERIFRGPTWSYLCLEAELPEPQSFLTTFVGDMPVVVARDAKGAIHAFENRCAHREAVGFAARLHGDERSAVRAAPCRRAAKPTASPASITTGPTTT